MGLSMVTSRYHYVEWRKWDDRNKTVGELSAVELYDQDSDPNENTNIAGLNSSKPLIRELSEQLRRGWRLAVVSQ